MNNRSNKFVARLLKSCGESMKINKQPSHVSSVIKLTTLLLFINSCFFSQSLFASFHHYGSVADYSFINQLHIEQQNSHSPSLPSRFIETVCYTENQTESDSDEQTNFERIEFVEFSSTVLNDNADIRTKAHHFTSLVQQRPVLSLYVLFHTWKSFIC